MSFMGATGEIYDLTLQYVSVILFASLLKYLFNVLDGIIRGEGRTKVSMMMMLTAILTNIVLDPFLIFGIGFFPRMEIAGAALATAISWGVGCCVVLSYYLRGKGIVNLSFKDFKLDLKSMSDIIKVGFPSALSQAAMAVMIIFLSRIILNMDAGEKIIAAYGFIGLGMVSNASFQGIGRGIPPLVNTFLRLILLQLSFAYLLAIVLNMGAVGLWRGILLSNIMFGIVSYLWATFILRTEKNEV